MVKRKYLRNIYIITILVFCNIQDVFAIVWMPDKGRYNIAITYNVADQYSQNSRDKRSKQFINIQNKIYALGMKKAQIYQKAVNEKRELLNSETHNIANIEQILKELEQQAIMLSSFSDDQFACYNIEYGVTNNDSLGTKISYKDSSFTDIGYNSEPKLKVGYDVDLYYKHKFYDNKGLTAVFQPKVNLSCYSHSTYTHYYELALAFNKSKKKRNYSTYSEIIMAARNHHNQNINKNFGYIVAISEGINFNNGISINNFTEYTKADFFNILYRYVLYDQLSVAKDFYFGKLKSQKFTMQLGYFWKTSLVKSVYSVSGPLFSLWFDA